MSQWRRAVVRVRRAHRPGAGRRPSAATFLTLVAAGLLISVSALAASGGALRPTATTELTDLLAAEAERNAGLAATAAELRAEVDALAEAAGQGVVAAGDEAAMAAGAVPVRGSGVTVVLDDAPLSVKPAGVDEDMLVVHQQDIQAVVNALWAGGAEAMSIQGQRVSARTGVKCVGNTVVLHGVPYAPPYRITAIGDRVGLEEALADSSDLQNYRAYARAYRLGWEQHVEADVTLPAVRGAMDMTHAVAD